MQSSKLLVLATVLCFLVPALGQLDWGSVTSSTALQAGDGTFYGLGQDAQGTCSYSGNFANTNGLPWSTGTAMTIAMNDAQFSESAACGMCVQFRGTGSGLGTTPIPSTWTMAIVNNRCPECAHGSIDLAAAGDGRWKIQWYAVPCNVGNTPLTYSIVVSSYYWFSMVVSNTRIPISGVSVQIGGTWLNLKRSVNNQWAYYNTNGPWQSSFPMGVRVTSITGETVQDTITSVTGNTGTRQFSADGSGSTAAIATPSTVPATIPTGAYTPPTPPVANPPIGASPPASPSPPPATPPVANPPVTATPPVSYPPPPATTPAPPSADLPAGSFYIQNYQQCGGTGMMCNSKPYTSAPCVDAAWTAAVCQSSGFSCTRGTAEIWSCLPGKGASPPVSGSTAGSTASPPVSAATPVPTATAAPTPTPTASEPPAGINPVTPSPTPTATSTPATTATQSTPSPTQAAVTSTALSPPPAQGNVATSSIQSSGQSPPATARQISIAAGGQCGGTSQCDPVGAATDKVTCSNGPWAGASCPDGYTCVANPGPLVWTCMGAASSQSNPPVAGRRLLGAR